MQIAHGFILYVIVSIITYNPQIGLEGASSTRGRQNNQNVGLCEIARSPQEFDNKIVKVRGKAIVGSESFTLSDVGCKKNIWLEYPDEVIADSHRQQHKYIKLIRNQDLANLQAFIAASTKETPERPCMSAHCALNDVTATVEGRIDYRSTQCKVRPKVNHDSPFQCGFGHMGAWNVRLTIQSVSNVVAVPREK